MWLWAEAQTRGAAPAERRLQPSRAGAVGRRRECLLQPPGPAPGGQCRNPGRHPASRSYRGASAWLGIAPALVLRGRMGAAQVPSGAPQTAGFAWLVVGANLSDSE